MPESSEHNLDKQLRDLAAQRKQSAGSRFDLHPVNRRQLQDEIRKRYGPSKNPPSSWVRTLILLWPRWAMAMGLLAALVVVVQVMNFETNRPMDLAQAPPPDTSKPQSGAASPSLSPAQLSEENQDGLSAHEALTFSDAKQTNVLESRQYRRLSVDILSDREAGAEATGETTPSPESTTRSREDMPRPAPTIAERPLLKKTENKAAFDDTVDATRGAKVVMETADVLSNAVGGTEPIRQPALPAEKDAFSFQTALREESLQKEDTISTNFGSVQLRRESATANASAAELEEARLDEHAILNLFRIQRSGDRIALFDEDGSLYRGAVISNQAALGLALSQNEENRTSPARTLAEPLARDGSISGTNGFWFNVIGTNRSTGSRVALSGWLQTNQLRLQLGRSVSNSEELLNTSDQDPRIGLPILQLEGALRLGTNAPTALRAHQVSP